jgi:restriction system protein
MRTALFLLFLKVGMSRRRRKDTSFDFIVEMASLAVILPLLLFAVNRQAGIALIEAFKEFFFLLLEIGIVSALAIIPIALYRAKASALDTSSDEPPETASPQAELANARVKITVFDRNQKNRALERRCQGGINVNELDWYQFEKLSQVIYSKLGYAVTRRGGAKADGGIDLVIERGGKRTGVQCKHWKEWNVGVRHVRELLGAMNDQKLDGGILLSSKEFTREAADFARRNKIELVDESALKTLLVQTEAAYDPTFREVRLGTKRCPRCDSEMVLREARRGANPGKRFWGCQRYPRCRGKLQVG